MFRICSTILLLAAAEEHSNLRLLGGRRLCGHGGCGGGRAFVAAGKLKRGDAHHAITTESEYENDGEYNRNIGMDSASANSLHHSGVRVSSKTGGKELTLTKTHAADKRAGASLSVTASHTNQAGGSGEHLRSHSQQTNGESASSGTAQKDKMTAYSNKRTEVVTATDGYSSSRSKDEAKVASFGNVADVRIGKFTSNHVDAQSSNVNTGVESEFDIDSKDSSAYSSNTKSTKVTAAGMGTGHWRLYKNMNVGR